jgi:hypothetical protein
MNSLHYFSQYRVLVCKSCQHAIYPKHIIGHLQSDQHKLEGLTSDNFSNLTLYLNSLWNFHIKGVSKYIWVFWFSMPSRLVNFNLHSCKGGGTSDVGVKLTLYLNSADNFHIKGISHVKYIFWFSLPSTLVNLTLCTTLLESKRVFLGLAAAYIG